jgi:hypothetical protein
LNTVPTQIAKYRTSLSSKEYRIKKAFTGEHSAVVRAHLKLGFTTILLQFSTAKLALIGTYLFLWHCFRVGNRKIFDTQRGRLEHQVEHMATESELPEADLQNCWTIMGT